MSALHALQLCHHQVLGPADFYQLKYVLNLFSYNHLTILSNIIHFRPRAPPTQIWVLMQAILRVLLAN